MFTSILQVFKVDDPEVHPGRNGSDSWTAHNAQCALLDDAGVLQVVGRLRIPERMLEVVKPGIFRASFALEVAQWGKTKGDIQAVLVGLMPVAPRVAPSASK